LGKCQPAANSFRSPRNEDSTRSSTSTNCATIGARYPKKRLRATQAASERAEIFGPACTSSQDVIACMIGAGAQKI
jgi:hypothetical protein